MSRLSMISSYKFQSLNHNNQRNQNENFTVVFNIRMELIVTTVESFGFNLRNSRSSTTNKFNTPSHISTGLFTGKAFTRMTQLCLN